MVSRSLFTRAVYAFFRLQKMDCSFECHLCGPEPRIVIADGVSISHGSSSDSTLQPPTHPSEHSPIYPDMIPPAPVTFVFLEDDRKTVRRAIDFASDFGWDKPELQLQVDSLLQSQCGRAKSIGVVLERFIAETPSRVQWRLWKKLLGQISTNDSILLVCRQPSLIPLATFLGDDDDPADWQQLDAIRKEFPAMGDLLQSYNPDNPPPYLMALVKNIVAIAHQLYDRLSSHATEPPDDDIEQDENSWQTTGCCYGLPQIRHRPRYPNLKEPDPRGLRRGRRHDQREQIAPGACQKFFSKYGKRAQTGGIMALWCKHAVCLGFHCIPSSEGRNDVFSAVYTRWRIAPEVIVYDFGCSLGAYCLAREVDYFSNTLFVIDQFHEDGHRTCSESVFLRGYMANDPNLSRLNSSAAESGNSCLGRIRKSVSYASPTHAILLTHHFMCSYNRVKLSLLR